MPSLPAICDGGTSTIVAAAGKLISRSTFAPKIQTRSRTRRVSFPALTRRVASKLSSARPKRSLAIAIPAMPLATGWRRNAGQGTRATSPIWNSDNIDGLDRPEFECSRECCRWVMSSRLGFGCTQTATAGAARSLHWTSGGERGSTRLGLDHSHANAQPTYDAFCWTMLGDDYTANLYSAQYANSDVVYVVLRFPQNF